MRKTLAAAALLAATALAACAAPSAAPEMGPQPGSEESNRLPPVPARNGPLALSLVHPGEGDVLSVDSTFVFGSTGTGQATLRINGAPVKVAPNGAFLAFLPVPANGVYQLTASANGQTAQLTRTVKVPSATAEAPTPAPAPAPVTDSMAAPSPLRVGVAATDRPDDTVIATAVPGSGTPYNWFFPNGTVLVVDSTYAHQYRVRLTSDLHVWVDSAEVRLLPAGTPTPQGAVGTVSVEHHPRYLEVHLATSARLPFKVQPADSGLTVTVYGAQTRTNWLYYGAPDSLVRSMRWEQVRDGEYQLHVRLNESLWGYLPYYDPAGNLVVRVRVPPIVDPSHPLRGLYIAVDAGHPPGGAIGPTGLAEATANLAIAKKLAALLREQGARVLETRPTDAAVALGARPLMATDSSVDLLVSVHNNAFPEGVNPFGNTGTSAFYNQVQSRDLARDLQNQLVAELGLRDLGIGRADLALVRPTWFPSTLTETMFLMVPQQEAALRNPDVQERIARAHLRGIEDFVRERARRK